MARISGINIPLNKRAEIGLTYIYGIGQSTANQVLERSNVSPTRTCAT
jgi:small subunit ribosomal protein S13